MNINLKTILLLSSLLAVILNVAQFVDSSLQRKDAFAPSWAAYADQATASPSPAGRKATPLAATPTPTPNPTPSVIPPTEPTPAAAAAAAKLSAAGLRPCLLYTSDAADE